METIRVGGHAYSDPDVISLIRATGSLVDPRSAVTHQARTLNARFRSFDSASTSAFERIKIMASFRGLDVEPMILEKDEKERRDAVLIPSGKARGRKGQIFYNPSRLLGRIVFSIAHEISHTFFPSTTTGARFRNQCGSDSREANELERLCDLAASELVMPLDEFRREVGDTYSLDSLPRLCDRFGSSYEATLFRLASAHPAVAAAGLLRYRRRKSEEQARIARANQLYLGDFREQGDGVPAPKYRLQSFHSSTGCGEKFKVRWNKSFDELSCVYKAGHSSTVCTAVEELPNMSGETGSLEAVRAPFQRNEASPEFPDVLFFWLRTDYAEKVRF